MEMSDQLHAPVALPLGTHGIGSWVGPRAGVDAVMNRKIPSPTLRNKVFPCGEKILAPAKPPSRRTTLCRFSTTAYSIYSQLFSTSGSRLLHP